MKKKLFVLLSTFALTTIILTGCGCEHQWKDADCQNPQTCTLCNATQGEVGDHNWTDADCENPKTCSVCGETEGEAIGHDWTLVSFDAPKTCKNCGATEGGVLVMEEKDFSAFSDYPWYAVLSENTIVARDDDYNFTFLNYDGNKINEVNPSGDYAFSFNVMYLSDEVIFDICILEDEGLHLQVYDSNGESIFDGIYSYEDYDKSYGEYASEIWYDEYAYTGHDGDYIRVYSSESKQVAFYVNLKDKSIIAPEDFQYEPEYDTEVYSYFEPQPDLNMYFVSWADNEEWGYLDENKNKICSYMDASAFSKEGFALVSDDRKTYSIIDSDFNVIAENVVEGNGASYSVETNLYRVTDSDGNSTLYTITAK